jgi:hypothetical protein
VKDQGLVLVVVQDLVTEEIPDQDRDTVLTDIPHALDQKIAAKADLPEDSEVVIGQKTDLASRFTRTYCEFN